MTRGSDKAEHEATEQMAEAGREATGRTAEAEAKPEVAIQLTDIGRDVVDAVERVTDDLQRAAQIANRNMGLVADISQPMFDAMQRLTAEISHCIQEDARTGTDFVWVMFERRNPVDPAELQQNLTIQHLQPMAETSERITRVNTEAITMIRECLAHAA